MKISNLKYQDLPRQPKKKKRVSKNNRRQKNNFWICREEIESAKEAGGKWKSKYQWIKNLAIRHKTDRRLKCQLEREIIFEATVIGLFQCTLCWKV